MEEYEDVSISCVINIVSLAIGVISPVVVWKTGFFDKEVEKVQVPQEPSKGLGMKKPSVYEQYDNDELYDHEKPEKKVDLTDNKSEDYYEENYTKIYNEAY